MDNFKKPASRVETILQRMLGDDINIEKPASRVEYLLANLGHLLTDLEEEIEKLEGKTTRLLYSDSTNPTASDIDAFVIEKGYTSPYEGVAVVIASTYHIWHYYENDNIGWRDDGVDTITPFTNSLPGSILGSVDDGKVTANNDGTGSVNGWNDKLNSIAAALAYNNTKAYTIDEICTYNGHLYICIQNTTEGTLPTNTTYWEEISVIQLINEFKLSLKNGSFIVEKANKANAASSTKAIDPISDESGTIHEVPFISQGTGTANNTASVDTGAIAKVLVKQGNTVVRNQLVKFADVAEKTENDLTFSANATTGAITIDGTSSARTTILTSDIPALKNTNGHKCLIRGYAGVSIHSANWDLTNDSAFAEIIVTSTNSTSQSFVIEVLNSGVSFSNVTFYPKIFDLTQYFGSNANIPQDLLDHPDHWSWYDNGTDSYNTGTMTDCNGRYLVCTGRNLFDKATAVTGYISDIDGRFVSSATSKATDYIMVIPNRQFHIKTSQSSGRWGAWYDKDKNFISGITNYVDYPVVTAPANARYMRLTISYTGSGDVDTFGVSLYYSPEEGGEGYSEYYPYEEPKVYDTGIELLKSAGNAKDTKLPSGAITGNIGIYTFDGTEQWVYRNTASGVDRYIIDNAFTASLASISDNTTNIICSVGESGNGYSGTVPNTIETSGRNIYVCVATGVNPNTIWSSGVILYYELATPTISQGTTFPENIEINDYGMMYWLDTDGNLVSIPQGCKLFYPVDYVLYLDTLVSHTEGDATSLIRWSDMATQSEIDEILDLI